MSIFLLLVLAYYGRGNVVGGG
eukprot:COSAG02_NODE_64979_length_259_cov_0.643750_1_plen_21_part_01